MNFASIKNCDIANGVGVRVSLFVSGCRHHCKNCFNFEAWDFNYGEPFTDKEKQYILDLLKPDYIQGLSLLGGEPMEPENIVELVPFLKEVKEIYPNKTIWCYSGFTYEYLRNEMPARCKEVNEMFELIDILVDGKFVEELKDITLRFRGSSNQRVIDVKKTLSSGEVVIWKDL